MTTQNAKDKKLVITFLSVLSLLVLGSFIIDKNPIDAVYLLFVIVCLIRYLLNRKSDV